MATLAEFNGQIEAFMERTVPEEIEVFVRKLAGEGLRRVVLKTPVDTGRARGSWQVSHGSPAVGDPDRTDPSGGVSIAEGLAEIQQGTDPFGVVYITSNLAYILALENGHSGQAPEGMVATTIAELEAAFP